MTIFDPENLQVISEVKISNRDTDDIEYEPASKRVFTFNGGNGSDATAIDAVRGIVVGQIPLGGKPETAQADGQGHIYVNIEDKDEVAVVDTYFTSQGGAQLGGLSSRRMRESTEMYRSQRPRLLLSNGGCLI